MKIVKFTKSVILSLFAFFIVAGISLTAEAATEIGTTEEDGDVSICVIYDVEEPEISFTSPSGKIYSEESDYSRIEHYSFATNETIYYISNEKAGTWNADYEAGKNTAVEVYITPWYDENDVTINEAGYEIDGEEITAHVNASYSENNWLDVYVYALTLDDDGNVKGKTLLRNSSIRQGSLQNINYISTEDLPDGNYELMIEVVGYADDGSEHSDSSVIDTVFTVTGHTQSLDGEYLTYVYDIDNCLVSIDWSSAENNADSWSLTVTNVLTGETVYQNEFDRYDDRNDSFYADALDGNVTVKLAALNYDDTYSVIEKEINLVPDIEIILSSETFTNSTNAVFKYNSPSGTSILDMAVNDSSSSKFRLEGSGTFSVTLDSMFTNTVTLNFGYDDVSRFVKSYEITVDNVAPVLDLFAVGETVYADSNKIILTGVTEAGATLSVSGEDITVEEDGTFKYNAHLSSGDNILEFEAVDKAGNRTLRTVKVVCSSDSEVVEEETTDNRSFIQKYFVLFATIIISFIVLGILGLSTVVSRKRSAKLGCGMFLTIIRMLLAVIKALLGIAAVGFLGIAGYYYYQSLQVKNGLVGEGLISTLQNTSLSDVIDLIEDYQLLAGKVKIPVIIAAVCLIVMIAVFVLQGIFGKRVRAFFAGRKDRKNAVKEEKAGNAEAAAKAENSAKTENAAKAEDETKAENAANAENLANTDETK